MSVFLLLAVPITLAAMACVLAVQVIMQRSQDRVSHPPVADPQWAEARVAARRSSLIDQSMSIIFIGVTWVIFYELGAPDAQALGPGWTFPSRGWTAVPRLEIVAVLAITGLLGVAVALLWRRHAQQSVEARLAKFRPVMIEPIPAGVPASCEFAEAYRYAVADREAPASDHPTVHSGDLRFFTLLSLQGALPRQFVICRSHSVVFARIEAFGRRIVARR